MTSRRLFIAWVWGLAVSIAPPASAQSGVSMAVDTDLATPGVQTSRGVAVGQIFAVQVVLQSASEVVTGLEVELAFNPAVLRTRSVQRLPALAEPSYELGRIERTGFVRAAWLMLGGARTVSDGVLQFEFEAIGAGAASLRVANATIAGPYGARIAFTQGAAPTIVAGGTTTPVMALSRSSLAFAAVSTGSAFASKTGAQDVRLSQSGAGVVTWTATPSHPWITVSPASGTGPATLLVGVQPDPSLSLNGTASGTVSVAFTGASAAGGTVAVSLTTKPATASSAPTGAFDTPDDGATGVTGSVALTGWAMDDVEVKQVRIVRSPSVGVCDLGQASSWIPVGTATMVDGARPDVAALNPGAPRNTRAGWGYMMLSNFLPNGGNGRFTFCAVADDVDGHSAVLGAKTLTFDNANAAKPFGAIDTPGQGEVISGSSFFNFGWVLANAPDRADPPSGGQVTVFVNSVPVGSPTGWTSRSDLTALFPANLYPGIVNAAGVYTMNLAAVGEGVHTIAWVVRDTNNDADGVGSRYFTIAGTGSAVTMAPAPSLAAPEIRPLRVVDQTMSPASHVNEAAAAGSQVSVRRGFDLSVPLTPVNLDASGRATIDAAALDRIELHLGSGEGTLTGYMRVGSDLASLPIGSRLDEASGTFGWQPGVGFVGTYDLVFVRTKDGRVVHRQEVSITLDAKRR